MESSPAPRLWQHALVWAAIALTHALVAIADAARRNVTIATWALLGAYLLGYLPWIALSWWFAGTLTRRPALTQSRWAFARLVGVTIVGFFVPQLLYQAVMGTLLDGRPLQDVPARLRATPVTVLVLDAVLFVATGAVVAARTVSRQREGDEERRRRLDLENAALRLETTRQQLRVLQSQLEPHFLFNALNAIAATVRTGDNDRAQQAIQQVAALLRFAVGASKRDLITWGEELAFIGDYLALQRLRFGDRLQVQLDANDPRLVDRTCPPLILQPLVENAIRHSLECGSGPMLISISVDVGPTGVSARVRNPLVHPTAGNPGLGAGLASLRGRLALAYAHSAHVETREEQGAFIATLHLPGDDDD